MKSTILSALLVAALSAPVAVFAEDTTTNNAPAVEENTQEIAAPAATEEIKPDEIANKEHGKHGKGKPHKPHTADHKGKHKKGGHKIALAPIAEPVAAAPAAEENTENK